MSNMSYCRFENTRKDLQDCIEALVNREIKSDNEKKNAKWLLKDILVFCEEEDIIEGYNREKIDEVLSECE